MSLETVGSRRRLARAGRMLLKRENASAASSDSNARVANVLIKDLKAELAGLMVNIYSKLEDEYTEIRFVTDRTLHHIQKELDR